jgi:CheY-like chemotaxis protein
MTAQDGPDILLIEDNRSDADLTTRALVKGGFNERVLWVQDGVEALDFLRGTGDYQGRDTRRFPKLVLLDLKMPRLDGFDVLRALKADERTRSIPIVVLTSSNQTRDVAESYRLGANGYVTKPIDFAKLTLTISQIANYWLRINQVPK